MSISSNETSNYYGNKKYREASVDLADDSNKLGGITFDEYALKTWVNDVFEKYVEQFNLDIDTKNLALKEVLKAYIDTSIRIQAENNANTYATKIDLEALEKKLRTELQKYAEGQAETALGNSNKYTDKSISELNSNISKSLTALNTYINEKYQELFQSVSNGKSKIAGAITGKGVSTSATDTFDKMANNINRIITSSEIGGVTGGGSTGGTQGGSNIIILPGIGGGDWSPDAGEGSFGANLELASTLIPSDITAGKFAYGANGLIEGTHECYPETYPAYGVDTSSATASANDILEGKTAYARGVKLIGTLKQVEEVHNITLENIKRGTLQGWNTEDYKYNHNLVTLSPDGEFMVSVVTEKATNETIVKCNMVGSEQIYDQFLSNGSAVKYKYTLAELGITGTIEKIKLSSRGYRGNNSIGVLAITEKNSDNILVRHFYPFQFTNCGIIYASPRGSYRPVSYTLDSTDKNDVLNYRTYSEYGSIAFANFRPDIVAFYNFSVTKICILNIDLFEGKINLVAFQDIDGYYPNNFYFSNNDKFLVCSCSYNLNNSCFHKAVLLTLNNSYHIIGSGTLNLGENTVNVGVVSSVALVDDTRMIVVGLASHRTGTYSISYDATKGICKFNINESNNVYEVEKISTTKLPSVAGITKYPGYYTNCLGGCVLEDGTFVYAEYGRIIFCKIADDNTITYKVYNHEFSLRNNNEGLFKTNTGGRIFIHGEGGINNDGGIVSSSAGIETFDYGMTTETIGIRYGGNYYRKVYNNELTADKSDVTKNKIFIGKNGHPEVGTKEVN